jgi:predicted nuclease of predicted toxin-antitoxin system
MRFLLDQDVYLVTAEFLIGLGHDVIRAAQMGLSRAPDRVLLQTAQEQKRIFITRDRDFSNLVFVQKLGMGVLYLRMLPNNQQQVHQTLARVLETYDTEALSQSFIVIEATGYRVRTTT